MEIQAVADDITKAVADLRGVLDGDSAEEIRSKVSDLQKATMKIGEAIAKEGQSQKAEDKAEDKAGEKE